MTTRNVLFIMCDQLRWDHLAYNGHPSLRTRNIDWLASRGVNFRNAFVNSGVCGPSRMSFYSGRYPSSHGTTWNGVPQNLGELTLGQMLGDQGRALALAGKTHHKGDARGMKRLGIDGGSELGALLSSGGFTELDRYDGHYDPGAETGYLEWLRARGYTGERPWTEWVIGAIDERGELVSGYQMRNVHLPARIAKEHSETAYMTGRAIDFVERRGDDPWVLHLSYIKPHWPYIAPAPYHTMYPIERCSPVHRDPRELEHPHPVLAAYRQQEECANFMRDEVIRKVRPAYTGLVQEIDDNLGRLWESLERLGRFRDTLIVFTADHGDFLGDHWLGEKEQFYDTVQRIPFIVYDPDPAADSTRGTVDLRFVESVDAVPTFLEALKLPPHAERVEGRSLLALTRPAAGVPAWRDCVFSELDYAFRAARRTLGRSPFECRAWMARTERWKYVFWLDLPPQLFDLASDPDEFVDLGTDPGHQAVRDAMQARLLDWFMRLKRRTTMTPEEVEGRTASHKKFGVFFGVW